MSTTDHFEYSIRPGNAALTITSILGLGALGAMLWQLIPGYVLLLMIPALLMCLWQLANVPTYGIKITDTAWKILGGYDDLTIHTDEISYLHVNNRAQHACISVMLNDGTEVQLPKDCLPNQRQLIAAAQDNGIPVREVR